MPHYRLEPAQYTKPDGVDASYHMVDRSATGGAPILVVSFTGSCPDGSAGSPHAGFVSYMTMCGLHAFSPWAVVLDFRELDYRWGNSMLAVFQDVARFMDAENGPEEPPFPVIPVVSERSIGFESLLQPAGADGSDALIRDLDVAIEEAARRAKEWIEG